MLAELLLVQIVGKTETRFLGDMADHAPQLPQPELDADVEKGGESLLRGTVGGGDAGASLGDQREQAREDQLSLCRFEILQPRWPLFQLAEERAPALGPTAENLEQVVEEQMGSQRLAQCYPPLGVVEIYG